MSQGTAPPEARSSLAQLPGGIWALGFVSMLMDVSSEMIHALLPVYLVTVLGTFLLPPCAYRGDSGSGANRRSRWRTGFIWRNMMSVAMN